jgi:CYTH domain-containing protein
MATEHEYKYLLRQDVDFDELMNEFERLDPFSCCSNMLRQGYLSPTLRIRNEDDYRWEMTFKQKVGDRVIEINTQIPSRDGEDLWATCKPTLKKVRISYLAINSVKVRWFVDFFLDSQEKIYCVLAEVELDEGSPRPRPPEWLQKAMVYEVPLHDERFSSKSLADVEFARGLYDVVKAV